MTIELALRDARRRARKAQLRTHKMAYHSHLVLVPWSAVMAAITASEVRANLYRLIDEAATGGVSSITMAD